MTEARKAVVLGGTSAIGSLIVDGLVAEGYTTLFTYNRNAEFARDIQQRNLNNAVGVDLDLSEEASVLSFQKRLEDFGTPFAFVNSAGVSKEALCLGEIEMSLKSVTSINYTSPALLSAYVAKMMAPRRQGYIAHITSTSARRAVIGSAAYGASKVALERFTASLALELARFNVRTLCVAPAYVDTPMFDNFSANRRDEIIRNIPMRQILNPDDVSRMVISFLRGEIVCTGNTIILGNGEYVFI